MIIRPGRGANQIDEGLDRGGEIMLRRKVKWVCLGLLGLLIAFGVFYVCATHGFLWSIYVPIYDRLLCSIPTPPGLLSETDKVTLNPELPWGYREYKVDKDHEETVSFFTFELPRASTLSMRF